MSQNVARAVDPRSIRAALATLETELEREREMKNQMEAEISGGPSKTGYKDPKEALIYALNYISRLLTVVLEIAGLPETRRSVLEKWKGFEKNGGIGDTRFHPEFDFLESKPLDFVSTVIDGLRISTGDELGSADSYELVKLETILRKTPVLVRNRNVTPRNEHDVQRVMRNYLAAFFTEFEQSVKIHGVIGDFKPDCGVRNLRAALEFKYAAKKDEVSRAVGGVFEDISGYAGSSDWNRFYTVIYQTEAFESEDRVRSEMTRAGTLTWKAFLVTGTGIRGRHKKALAA